MSTEARLPAGFVVPWGTMNTMPYVKLGNSNPTADGVDSAVTTFTIPDGMAPDEALSAIKDAWPYHSVDGQRPAWVESDDEDYLNTIAFVFKARKGRPDDWEGLDED